MCIRKTKKKTITLVFNGMQNTWQILNQVAGRNQLKKVYRKSLN